MVRMATYFGIKDTTVAPALEGAGDSLSRRHPLPQPLPEAGHSLRGQRQPASAKLGLAQLLRPPLGVVPFQPHTGAQCPPTAPPFRPRRTPASLLFSTAVPIAANFGLMRTAAVSAHENASRPSQTIRRHFPNVLNPFPPPISDSSLPQCYTGVEGRPCSARLETAPASRRTLRSSFASPTPARATPHPARGPQTSPSYTLTNAYRAPPVRRFCDTTVTEGSARPRSTHPLATMC